MTISEYFWNIINRLWRVTVENRWHANRQIWQFFRRLFLFDTEYFRIPQRGKSKITFIPLDYARCRFSNFRLISYNYWGNPFNEYRSSCRSLRLTFSPRPRHPYGVRFSGLGCPRRSCRFTSTLLVSSRTHSVRFPSGFPPFRATSLDFFFSPLLRPAVPTRR